MRLIRLFNFQPMPFLVQFALHKLYLSKCLHKLRTIYSGKNTCKHLCLSQSNLRRLSKYDAVLGLYFVMPNLYKWFLMLELFRKYRTGLFKIWC